MSDDKAKKTSNSYKDTLFLPRTDFPMRAELAKREPGFLKFWDEQKVYQHLKDERSSRPRFILHDGPPYANAGIHIGTAMNKILKDLLIRYKWQRGYYAPYVPGYDTHGMPIEHKVIVQEGMTGEVIDPVALRSKCEAHARKFIKVQTEEFKRLGVMGDWENPYITLTSDFEAAQMGLFAEMVERGLVYRGRKAVLWCMDCQTALAAAEIEYEDDVSNSLYVRYHFQDGPKYFKQLEGLDVDIMIWTTTPWTLPASLMITLGPDYDYAFYRTEQGRACMIAVALKEEVEAKTGVKFGEELLRVKGRELERMNATHPFLDKNILVVLDDYVTLDSGTGCIHTATGHGIEDFETGVKYGMEIYNPVDNKGYFYPDTPHVGGMSLADGEKKVISMLTDNGRLVAIVKLKHSYPHCWRCKNPVIFRATDQWFVDVSKFRERALEVIDKEVRWIPAWGHDRIYNMVQDRSDWCISRQRYWGVPIPAFYCKDCGQVILTPDRIRAVAAKIKEHGSNIWWSDQPQQLLGDLAKCPHCGSSNIEKERDIMDVWFDSGCTHRGVLENSERWPELSSPCEIYLEGSDQHRGWFQSSMLTSVATMDRPPYKTVLTHGFIVDGKGRKMSKSLGNAIFPQEIVEKYGADILRMWVASTDYRNDISISMQIIQNLSESYRRIRNTARFLLANLSGFDPQRDVVPHAELGQVDQYILLKLADLVRRCTDGFDDYEFHVPMNRIHKFCDNELSSFYIDISKDELYADASDSHGRRCARSVMWEVLHTLVRMTAPVLAFTSEEIWQEMRKMDASLPASVHMTEWPAPDKSGLDESIAARWDRVMDARGAISRALESARSQGMIGHSLDASVWMMLSDDYKELAGCVTDADWEMISIVSKFVVTDKERPSDVVYRDETTGLVLGVSKDQDPKCPRCWKHRSEIGAGQEVCDRCADVLKNSGHAH